jgi:hypothetical protein
MDKVLLKERYYQDVNGKWRCARYVEDNLVSDVECWTFHNDLPFTKFVLSPWQWDIPEQSLVKEGPKAIVLHVRV